MSTLNEFVAQFNQLLYNIENQESLRPPLTAIGYNLDELNNGRSLLNTLEETVKQRDIEYRQQLIATDAVEQAQEELEATYHAHRTLAQFVYRDNQEARLWYNSFRKLSDIIYANQPQLKEALNRSVPS